MTQHLNLHMRIDIHCVLADGISTLYAAFANVTALRYADSEFSRLSGRNAVQAEWHPLQSLEASPHCRAVGLGVSGRLYVGVNLEFARLPVNNSVHAEQFLVVNAVHHEERAITKMAVSAAPCGHCRQFYSELCCAVRSSSGNKQSSKKMFSTILLSGHADSDS